MDINKFNKKTINQRKKLIDFLNKFDDKVPDDIDEIIAVEDKKVWEETDCLACANCCKQMTPTYTNEDIKRIATHLRMSVKDFKSKWLYKEPDKNDWVNKSTPCQFLGTDNKCSIYEVRPLDCAEFPHHFKKPFDLYNETYIQNLSYCPATYNFVEKIKKRIEKEYEW